MIIFSNPGSLDLRAVTTFGLTSKEGQGKIGRFGTGLKYALATVLRGGGEVTIHSQGEIYAFSVEPTDFRGQDHQQVTLNGEPLPFTTSLGRDWEPWMAFRELYSNALDEGGGLNRLEDSAELPPSGGEATQVIVKMPAFEAIYFTIEEHFIIDEKPLWSNEDLEVYRGRSQFVFYRGIAVMKLKKPAAFRYNIKSYVMLTEDRTAQYPFTVHSAIARALVQVTDEEIAQAVTLGTQEYEGTLDFMEDAKDEPSATFLGAAAKQGINCNKSAAKLIEAYTPEVKSNQARIISPAQPGGKCLLEALAKLRVLGEDISAVNWVLDPSTHFASNYFVRGKAIFICPSVFNDQSGMDRAVFEAWQTLHHDNWLADKLVALANERLSTQEN
jgi:hypothetical protein